MCQEGVSTLQFDESARHGYVDLASLSHHSCENLRIFLMLDEQYHILLFFLLPSPFSDGFSHMRRQCANNRFYFITNNVAQLIHTIMGVKPDDFRDTLILPPQCVHVDFDGNMKVKVFGFYTVDRQYGNTGGIGGAFGLFYGVAKPLPFREAQPLKRSFRFRLFNALARIGASISKQKTK